MLNTLGLAILDSLFHLKVPVAEKLLRPILVYVFLVLLLRVFGKRELAQLNPFDLVVLLSLSNTVQNAIIGDDNSLIGGLLGAFSLLAINYAVVRFLFRHRRLDEVLEGSPTTLIEKGKIIEKNLGKELMSRSELLSVAHRQGFGSLEEIDHCSLEPGGVFYIKGKAPNRDEDRHAQLISKMDELSTKIAGLEQQLRNSS